jgi:two-component system response regulator NreC
MDRKIRVGIVEDQPLFRQGLKAIISAWEDVEVVFESGEGFTIAEKLQSSAVMPDILLVDISLPPDGTREFGGVQVTDVVTQQFPEIKIIILSIHSEEHFISELIAHGAHGYLVKDSNPHEVHEAIKLVYEKGSYINQRALHAIQRGLSVRIQPEPVTSSPIRLTRREEEILQLICRQNTTEEIAEKLFISTKTVDGHRNNLLQKTGSRNTAGLVAFALTNNIVSFSY